ncbi:hypothetical protein [Flavivirga eckloniae]|uniref:Uncharacterized protein n=1 Tax=Flavivirga eckloniae TaxID=1803846 RepID=A0A2K9PKB2_9FLAO|nr:hypothetical protein [Flavivirga eckloniae]AUP77501.1 hypothetical protein C1H87_01695 [Flavivirga eckloniae]
MRKILHIAFSILINFSVFGQIDTQTDSVSFDKITSRFKETKGWNIFSGELKDSIDTTFLYQTKDFNVSISENPIAYKTFHTVIKNPYFTDDFDDYDDNYINYPVSYSVIHDNRLVSLFRNGKFVCHRLSDFERDLDFEKKLNTRKFKYHWIVNDKLGALSGNLMYIWNGSNWTKNKTVFPLKNQPKLFEDTDFTVYGDCHGEWGGTIYFFDKTNGETYFTESSCTNSVIKKGDSYLVLAHLGHMTGSTEIKTIKDPRKLTQAKKTEINKTKNGQALGYADSTKAYEITLDYWGIQLFSTFNYEDRQLFMVYLNEKTFLAEIVGNEFQIVHPLFNNEIYTHDPITNKYGKFILMNLDHYGTARDKEISVMIIDGKRLIKLDWNENHSR